MSFAEIRPTTGYCEYFENDIKNVFSFIFLLSLQKYFRYDFD